MTAGPHVAGLCMFMSTAVLSSSCVIADVTVAGLEDGESGIRQLLRGAFAVWALTGLWCAAQLSRLS